MRARSEKTSHSVTQSPPSVVERIVVRSGPSRTSVLATPSAPGWRYPSGNTRFGMPRNCPADPAAGP